MKAPSNTKEVKGMGKDTEMQSIRSTDEQIIELYWQKDEKAIAETEIKYGKMLFRIAYNILHNNTDCEECKNDTYLCIWNRIPPTRPVAFYAFISKIMRDIAINKYNETKVKRRVPSELTVSLEELCNVIHTDNSPENEYAERELSRLISGYIRELPKRQHYIFIGRFYFGNRLEHIADELGISAATVGREIVKLKAGLKAYLERNGVYV